MSVKFSPANSKLKNLYGVESLKKWTIGKKIYSFDMLSGHGCPFANECLSKAVEVDGKRKIQDGPNTIYRCFSASQEVLYSNVYNLRKNNFDAMRSIATNVNLSNDEKIDTMSSELQSSTPKKTGIVRIHVGSDFFNPLYFRAWLRVAQVRPDVLFYAYTKSLKYWIENRAEVDRTENFVLTASRGGRLDNLIDKAGLRSSVVVYSVAQAEKLGLEIDHDDSHAADPTKRNQNFALLIHGSQPPGSEAGKAVRALNGLGSYGRGARSGN